WIFGKIICIFFITADVCLCTASILNLLVISLDRYLAITQPLKYARRKNGRLAFFLVLFVWLASLLLCAPPLLVPDWRIEFGGPSQECRYVKAIAFRVYSALGSFYIPLAIMIGLYVKIYRVVSQRENQIAVSGGSSDGSCKAEGDSRTSEKLSKKRSSIMQIWQHKKGKSANGTSYRRPPPPPPTSVHMRTSSDSGNGRYRRGRDDDQDSDVNVHAYASQQNSDRRTNKNSGYRCSDWTPINNGGTTAATTAAERYSTWCQEEDEFFELKSNKRPKIERLSHTEILARKKQYSALLAELCRQYGTISGAELVAPTVKMSRWV
uniref:G-protein coupled receptors family 1 profile domain-containing protein n=1 Tax=Romanomermis culicivorax TaxID=13658 RepID=A0A915L1N6_ROMCU